MIPLFIFIYMISILIVRAGLMSVADGKKSKYIIGLVPGINTLIIIIAWMNYAFTPIFELLYSQIKDLFSHKNYLHPWRWYTEGVRRFKNN